ncbi:MAG: hypothetical protein KDA75_17630 [Planctomycetaceae bacterium]|nr:hypothetical protein [Planctomycetaceae bacterium]
MQRAPRLIFGTLAVLLVLFSTSADARRPGREGMLPEDDPLGMGMPFDWPDPESPWGPAPYLDYGSWSPTGGTWDKMLKSGLTTASGIRWKSADFSGDLLPPSSTYFLVNHRYAYLKDDADVQLVGPGGFVGDVGNARIHLFEFSVSQRFIGPIRRGPFVDVGCGVGIGGVDGEIYPAAPTPGDDRVYIKKVQEDGVIVRGELNCGAGWQARKFDLRFGVSAGLSGSNAMSGSFRSQTDIGTRVGATLYLFE